MTPLNEIFSDLRSASLTLPHLSLETTTNTLLALAENLRDQTDAILEANERDLTRLPADYTLRPRLILTSKKIDDIAIELLRIARLPSPIHHILEEKTLENGLELERVSVPLGVVGVIYEARPNVTVDIFALCFKSGNACILKGGSDAYETNRVLVQIIKETLAENMVPPTAVHLLGPGHAETDELLRARGFVDVIIPRGSQKLIEYVRDNARVPVIETGAGVCHTYLDVSAHLDEAAKIVENAKTNRPTACNALDTLIVHEKKLKDLPALVTGLITHRVHIFADEPSLAALSGHYPSELLELARPEHFGTEYLSLRLAIKTVPNLEAALSHIASHGSKHSETILATEPATIQKFLQAVDAAVVYANASTALTDGGVFGLGAEVGISTQKLHARGPMGMSALTSYKWLARGHGQIRL